MATNILEFFGYHPYDKSSKSINAREKRFCPFLESPCQKRLRNGDASGACTLEAKQKGAVICCPYRLYAGNYQILRDVSKLAFGENIQLVRGDQALASTTKEPNIKVAVFGKNWGKELRLPKRRSNTSSSTGAYFVDWVLARLDNNNALVEFVAVEVQSIDTTGNYQQERTAYLNADTFNGSSTAGFNWENVNKRILPQIIYKGHVLRRERLCKKGLFFVCPEPVYNAIQERLGGNMYPYPLQAGSLSMIWYNLGERKNDGAIRDLEKKGEFITTVDQVANAFTSPSNLPEANVYEQAILAELSNK